MATKKSKRKRRQQRNMIIAAIAVLVAIILIIVVVFVFKKNKSGNTSVVEETAVEESSEEILEEEEVLPTDRSYLTGLPLEEEKVSTRPIASMIENTKESLPQYGLNDAGIIYECPVEGSYTRMMAIFDDYEDVPKIGNVRSCRDYFAYIAREYEAIYVHYGQSIYAKEGVLKSGLIDNLNGLDGEVESTVFYRTSDKAAPHNVFTNPDMILAGVEVKGYSMEYSDDHQRHFLFTDDGETNTLEDKNGIQVHVIKPYYFYNHPYFIYNEEDQKYYRYEFGKEEVDANYNTQVAVTNVIYQFVSSSKYDATEYLNIPLVGAGSGTLFTNGKMVDIRWYKEDETSPTRYFYTDGNEIVLNQGQTWICLIETQYLEKNEIYTTVEEFNN